MECFNFCILLPQIILSYGHVLPYAQSVEEAALMQGLNFTAYVSHNLTIDLPSKNWNCYFKGFFKDCSLLLCTQKDKTVFFIETYDTTQLTLLTMSLLLFAKKNTEAWILFRYGLGQYIQKGRIHLFLCFLLRKKLGNRFKALTDSEEIKKTFATKVPLHVMPIPHTEEFTAIPSEKKIFWWPGQPRGSKGLKEMLKLSSLSRPPLIEIVAAKASNLPVTLIDDILSREEYRSWMGKSSVILLPYDAVVYRYGTSGILIEAITAGKMPLVKKGSWLAGELARHALNELIVDFEDPAFFENTLALLENKSVQKKLNAMQKAYRSFHSVENFALHIRDLARRTSFK